MTNLILESELECANKELDEQLAKSNFITRWIARYFIQSKYRDNLKAGITHSTNILSDILQKL
jgi:hypothetical protein